MNTDLQYLLLGSPQKVARALIGWTLVSVAGDSNICTGGIICETEAYLPQDDPAAHGRRGKTKANASLFECAGTIYVHEMHTHFLLDIVTQEVNVPGSVLIRGLKPTLGIDLIRARRGVHDIALLCNGPGKLSKALAITKSLDGRTVFDQDCPIRLLPPGLHSPLAIKTSMRIGVTQDLPEPMRFYIDTKDLPENET